MQKRICLISDHHLCINPRLWKEAFVYEKMGYEVMILTKWQSKEHKQRDLELIKGHSINYLCFLNITPGEIAEWKRFYYRIRKRVASELQRYFKLGGAWAINHAPGLLYKKALELNADFYSAHLECGFYAGSKLLKAGKKVSFDFEDWYSRDYLTPDRATGLLQKLEHVALHYGKFCTAASDSMAKALQAVYQSKFKPFIIYNSFPQQHLVYKHHTQVINNNRFQIAWTSRTVGPNRGIETFLSAAKLIREPLDFHLIGECSSSYRSFLENEFPFSKGHQLIFHDFVNHDELLPMLSEFDAGLAIEQYEPDSRNTTVTNKILQYLQAGLQVLATDTAGQKEISEHFPLSVKTVKSNDAQSWAYAIEQMIQHKKNFNQEEQLNQFETFFSWQKQEEKLKKLINQYL